jgi:hypothetical protein
MRRFLSQARKLFSRIGVERSPSRRPFAKPQLEFLEAREVPSVSSALPHGDVATPFSGGAERIFFIVNKGETTEATPTPGLYFNNIDSDGFSDPVLLNGKVQGGPQVVTSISAGLGSNGDDDVFAEGGDGSLWKYTIGLSGWKEILGSGQVVSFAAVNGGEVFAINANHALELYNGTSWSTVPTPTSTVKALDAVTDKFGHNTVYVLNGNDSFGEVTYLPARNLTSQSATAATKEDLAVGPGTPGESGGVGVVSTLEPIYTQLEGAHIIRFNGTVEVFPEVTNFSAGIDANGNADVYATFWTGSLYQNIGNTPSGWAMFAPAGTYQGYSAVDQGQVWILNKAGAVTLHTEQNTPATYSFNGQNYEVTMSGPFTSLSGVVASGPYAWSVFTVNKSGALGWYALDSNVGVPTSIG